jgi:serine/threonine-protein kinase
MITAMPDERLDLARTIEARIVGDGDLATTLVSSPRQTIEPHRRASSGGVAALDALRKIGASLDGKIELHRTLGEGGMGIVHLATQATMGRHVAVKTLRDGAGDLDATLRILREAWITGALEHPNVVPVYDVGVDASGAPIIVMKRIAGSAWCDLIADAAEVARRFSAADLVEWNLRILTSVCNAVHFAHSRGILHRDLKPENVMVGAFGEVYVLDWGIAVSLEDDPSGRLPLASQAGEIAGTPCYMAPEMLLGDPTSLSPRTDVYLLGAIFYEIFAGAPPHLGDNVQAMISSVLLSDPVYPSHFPAEARGICKKAMARDPADRYESVEAFRLGVDEYLRHRGSRKLAHDAKQSLERLLHVLENDPSGDDRTLAIFNLLGECRFGYRAALAAWDGNEAARKGLDRALLAVVEHELREGDTHGAQTLLREVSAPPTTVTARVDAAIRERAEADERARKLEADQDPTVGGRTRTLFTAIFGTLWTVTPLVGWRSGRGGRPPTQLVTFALALGFLVLGLALFAWARDSLTKTALNRRVARTLTVYLTAQMVLSVGTWLAGVPAERSFVLIIFAWSLTEAMMAVWIEPWLALPAATCAATFLIGSVRPAWVYPFASLDNALLTYVLVRVWYPKQDLERIRARRRELQQRARKWLTEPPEKDPQ